MKIRLVEPKPPGVNVYDLVQMPRLGLPIIGTMLRDMGHDVKIYCEILGEPDWNDLATSDLVGISTTTSTAPGGYKLAERLAGAGVPVVMGGSHVTFLPEEALQHAPYVARGEGHETMSQLVAYLEGGNPALSSILGLSYREAGEERHNAERPPCGSVEFDALPIPDFELIVNQEKMRVRSVMTQWGCPFTCDFCSVIQMFGRKVKYRSVDRVMEELVNTKPRFVFFCDDNFVTDKKRTKELLRRMKEANLKFSWSAQMRAEAVFTHKHSKVVDEELLTLMHESGCSMVYVGFESVNPETLKAFHKEQDVSEIQESIAVFHRYDIRIHGMFVLGADQDTVKTVRQTTKFALKNQIDTVQFMLLQPLPGTPLYDRVAAEGRILHADWSLYDGHHAMVRPSLMSPYRLQLEVHRGMEKFYSNWQFLKLFTSGLVAGLGQMWKLFWHQPSLRSTILKIFAIPFSSRRMEIIALLRERLGPQNWDSLEHRMWVALLRRYGRIQVRKWRDEIMAAHYLDYLRGLEA